MKKAPYEPVKRNIRLICKYELNGVPTVKEAIVEICTVDLDTARELAITKVKKQLAEFSYIKNVSVEIKKREGKKKC